MSDRTEYVLREIAQGYYARHPGEALKDLEIVCQEARMVCTGEHLTECPDA